VGKAVDNDVEKLRAQDAEQAVEMRTSCPRDAEDPRFSARSR